jgi:AraC-like DNA-binding protein
MSSGDFHVRSVQGGAITLVDACSDRAFDRHSHDEYGIGIVTGGAQRSWSGRGTVEAKRGNLITVNPGEVHDGRPIGDRRSWSMLYLSVARFGELVRDLSEGRSAGCELHHPVVARPAIARRFIAARDAALGRRADLDPDEALLGLVGGLVGAPMPRLAQDDPRIVRLRDALDDDPAGPHPLAALAADAGLSRFQTLRAFARLTGLTPHAYAIQRRLERVRRGIASGTALADAAFAAGFADQSHMHRAFTARYGYTPGALAAARRRHRAISFKNAPPRCP